MANGIEAASKKERIMESVFHTDKRIRLGVWGLGRGQSISRCASALNMDVVAGCDMHPHMRETFHKNVPDAYVTDNEDDFLAHDFDAVLIATYFPDHARHTLKALAAGKHVMCEVTSFMTPAEAVQVVEAVEKSGKVYNLLENYPFSKENMFLRKLWQDGFFGEFMYGEFEYLHECRTLCYAYNVGTGLPVTPGWAAHYWRANLNFHYYNTHSLGPAMKITGLRPVKLVAPPCSVPLAGYLPDDSYTPTATPCMITMSNGGLVRNLMGVTTGDYPTCSRIWGTKASVEKIHGLQIRVGACGEGMPLNVKAEWPELGELAEKTGHGGGDFWEIYYFARQILTGEPAPWTIYDACDVTMAGVLAAKSARHGGITIPIPDFRNPAEREAFRNDEEGKFTFDSTRIFPDGHDKAITGQFNNIMIAFYPPDGMGGLVLVRKALDGMRLYPNLSDDASKLGVARAVARLVDAIPGIAENCKKAMDLAAAYPESAPAAAIRSALETVPLDSLLEQKTLVEQLRKWLAEI